MTRRTIGQTIETLRVLRGLSQRELAKVAGCSSMSIGRIEQGKQDPGVTLLRALLNALDADDRTRLELLR